MIARDHRRPDQLLLHIGRRPSCSRQGCRKAAVYLLRGMTPGQLEHWCDDHGQEQIALGARR